MTSISRGHATAGAYVACLRCKREISALAPNCPHCTAAVSGFQLPESGDEAVVVVVRRPAGRSMRLIQYGGLTLAGVAAMNGLGEFKTDGTDFFPAMLQAALGVALFVVGRFLSVFQELGDLLDDG